MKKKLKRVEGSDSLYRTPKGAIINTDVGSYNSYMRRKQSNDRKCREMKNLATELDEAKEEIKELKELIRKLLDAK